MAPTSVSAALECARRRLVRALTWPAGRLTVAMVNLNWLPSRWLWKRGKPTSWLLGELVGRTLGQSVGLPASLGWQGGRAGCALGVKCRAASTTTATNTAAAASSAAASTAALDSHWRPTLGQGEPSSSRANATLSPPNCVLHDRSPPACYVECALTHTHCVRSPVRATRSSHSAGKRLAG